MVDQTRNRRPRAGVLGLTLELYESLAPDLRPGREAWLRESILPRLAEFADVEFAGAVFRRQDVERVVGEYERSGCDCIIVVLLTYAPSQMALPALQQTPLPLLVWNTQELYGIGPDFTSVDMVRNHGVHGTQDLANVLLRAGRPFEYVTSHVDDPDGLAPVRDFTAAARAARRLRQLRVGLLGYPFPGMGDFAVDTTDFTARFGSEWVHVPIQEFVRRAEEADPKSVARTTDEYRREYDFAPDITDEDLEWTVRAEIALRAIVREYGLGALTYQFMAFGEEERSPTLPFAAASRLMAEGIGFGGEGDVVAAAGSRLLNLLQPPAGFVEIFTIDFEGDALFLSHMGEMNIAMGRRDRRPQLRVRPKPITPTRFRQTALVAGMEPGPATFAALTMGPEKAWRIVAGPVEIEDFGPLPDLPVPHAKVRAPGDVRDFLTAYACAGGPHHAALCFGDARRRLGFAARMLGIDLVTVP